MAAIRPAALADDNEHATCLPEGPGASDGGETSKEMSCLL